MRRFRTAKIIGIGAIGIVAIILFSGIVMLLWNALLPGLFHLPVITLWQALGLLVLCKILFGGFRPGPGPRRQMKDNMRQKWMNMTPEERDKFKQNWSSRCWRAFEQTPFPPEKGETTTSTERPA
jgi:hypothetical protein